MTISLLDVTTGMGVVAHETTNGGPRPSVAAHAAPFRLTSVVRWRRRRPGRGRHVLVAGAEPAGLVTSSGSTTCG